MNAMSVFGATHASRVVLQEGDYDYDEPAAIIRHDRPLNIGEIGCYLSTPNIWMVRLRR